MNIPIPTTITQKGQVTIPLHIRQKMQLNPGDRVIFTMDKDKTIVEKATNVIDMLSGIFYDPNRKPLSAKELRETAMNEIAKEAIARSQPKSHNKD